VWPVRVARSAPVAASQILRVLSSLAETMKEPSGLIAQALTQWVWPVSPDPPSDQVREPARMTNQVPI
jgi:hypothetical protein